MHLHEIHNNSKIIKLYFISYTLSVTRKNVLLYFWMQFTNTQLHIMYVWFQLKRQFRVGKIRNTTEQCFIFPIHKKPLSSRCRGKVCNNNMYHRISGYKTWANSPCCIDYIHTHCRLHSTGAYRARRLLVAQTKRVKSSPSYFQWICPLNI